MADGFSAAVVDEVSARAYRIPTEGPEEDGTLSWDATVLVVVETRAAGATGLGYTYADRATAVQIREVLAKPVQGMDAFAPEAAWQAMSRAVRNLGRQGVSAMAISAVDVALWDLKAKLLGAPLARLLGMVRSAAPVYGSGGFTNYVAAKLQSQLGSWVREGIPRVKMKVGAHPEEDPARVRAAREAIGPGAALFVDANGAYGRKQALAMALAFAEAGVVWYEEPVPAWDLDGTRMVRKETPPGMEVAGGEYGYRSVQFLRLLREEAVDCMQADITRCGGVTGFLKAAALCEAFDIPLSSHCAPSLHVAPGCATAGFRHLEYFFDHVRIEEMLFDGFRRPVGGECAPDLGRPGLGLEFKRSDAEKFAI